jgi:hypothetical protein
VFTRDVLDGKRILVTFAGLSQLSKEDWQRAREAIQASSRKEKGQPVRPNAASFATCESEKPGGKK